MKELSLEEKMHLENCDCELLKPWSEATLPASMAFEPVGIKLDQGTTIEPDIITGCVKVEDNRIQDAEEAHEMALSQDNRRWGTDVSAILKKRRKVKGYYPHDELCRFDMTKRVHDVEIAHDMALAERDLRINAYKTLSGENVVVGQLREPIHYKSWLRGKESSRVNDIELAHTLAISEDNRRLIDEVTARNINFIIDEHEKGTRFQRSVLHNLRNNKHQSKTWDFSSLIFGMAIGALAAYLVWWVL